MLEHTFVHVPGIGDATEQSLWELGVVDWQCALRELPAGVSARCRRSLPAAIAESREALDRGDGRFFAARLAPAHHWRLYPVLSSRPAFLDIETTGMGPESVITTVAVYDGRSIRTYVRDENLHEFPADIRGCDLLVTYNGKCFDAPFLEREFPGLRLDMPHIDLRYVLNGLDFRGGLKQCERLMGLPRTDTLHDVDGFMAVRLWHRHVRGDQRALPALLRYNIEDAVNLQWLMETAYNMLVRRLPITVQAIEVNQRPHINWPFDPSIIRELLGEGTYETHWSAQPRRWS